MPVERISAARHRATLRSLSKDVFDAIDQLSYVDAGFLLRAHLDDFVSGAFFLLDLLDSLDANQLAAIGTVSDVKSVNPELKPTLRRLCELSREVTFASDPGKLHPEIRESVEKLFRLVVDQFSEIEDEDARGYLEKIGQRTLQPIAIV